MTIGIAAAGGYVPRLRLDRGVVAAAHAWFAPGLKALGRGERAMANWDEDAVTMAVEAARDCLGTRDRTRVAQLVLASTSLPFLDRQNAGIVKEALNLEDGISTLDVGGSQRAGSSGLLTALHAARGGIGMVLCLASEKRRSKPGSEAELLSGDAAAAFLVGDDRDAPLLARFIGSHSHSIDFVDHFRGEGEAFDYQWEARWVRDEGFARIAPDAIEAALQHLSLEPGDISHFVMGAPMRGVPELVAKAAGIAAEAVVPSLALTLGDAGSAQPLVLLARTLAQAKAGERILVVGFGQGCDVLVFEATGEGGAAAVEAGIDFHLARRKPETNYLKYLAFIGGLDLDRGMRAEFDQKPVLTALYRNRKTVLGLVGGRCTKTGTVQYPRSEIGVAPNDRSIGTQEDYPLADRPARILTHTGDNLTFTPDPPAYYGMVEFEEGGRMVAEFTDIDAADVEVGREMRMVFRIKALDEMRGFTKYFWKATPVRRPRQAD